MAPNEKDADQAADLLDVTRTEIWPVLSQHPSLTRQEREQILGYDTETGV